MAIAPPIAPSSANLTSPWGWRKLKGVDDFHSGIDLSAAVGTPVLAVADGRVQLVDWVNGYGQTVVLKHAGPTYSLYGHLLPGSPSVAVGQAVSAGDAIAQVGRSAGTKAEPAEVSAPHLHFELLTAWPPRGKDLDRVDPTAAIWAPFAVSRTHASSTVQQFVRDKGLGSLLLVVGGLYVLSRAKRRRRHNPKKSAQPLQGLRARKAAVTAHVD